MSTPTAFSRRAKPLLGTLVEVGWRGGDAPACEAAFAMIAEVQAALSRFDPASEVARFNAMDAGGSLAVGAHALTVLRAATSLHEESDGRFDVSVGTGPSGWRIEGDRLHKLADAARLDLGGIAKGYAVDQAIDTLAAAGCDAGWVNAGGDLRAFGEIELPLTLRDENTGGVRPFASLCDGAFATSHFGPGTHSTLAAAGAAVRAHASVAAPLCMWADALTKILCLCGDTAHPLLARHGAQGWLH